MISNKRIALLGLAILVMTTSASAWYGWANRDKGPRTQMAWVYKGTDARELFDYADIVALGTVTAAYPGRVVYVNGGEDKLPYQLVEFSIESAVKGVRDGEVVMIERAGGMDPDGQYHVIDADGGEYWAGARYLLFLKWQENRSGYTYLINDAARYEIERGRLTAVDDEDPVSARFEDMKADKALDLLRSWN